MQMGSHTSDRTSGTIPIRPGHHTETLRIRPLPELSTYHSAGWEKNINELPENPVCICKREALFYADTQVAGGISV